jgi:hypothetical protein
MTETKPKRRWFSFSLSTLFIAITLVCVWLAWDAAKTRQRLRMVCDQLVGNLLLSSHWKAFESGNFRSMIGKVSDELNPQIAYRTSFLMPNGTFKDGTAPNAFEKQRLTEWSKARVVAGAPIIQETEDLRPLAGAFTYYKVIRASSTNCMTCHSAITTPVAWGDIIAIAKIELEN